MKQVLPRGVVQPTTSDLNPTARPDRSSWSSTGVRPRSTSWQRRRDWASTTSCGASASWNAGDGSVGTDPSSSVTDGAGVPRTRACDAYGEGPIARREDPAEHYDERGRSRVRTRSGGECPIVARRGVLRDPVPVPGHDRRVPT